MAEPTKLPTDSDSDAYVAGCREGKLLLQRCDSCGQWQFYPRRYCRHCHASTLRFHEVSGRGVVHSFTIVRRAPTAAFADRVPYAVAVIELAEGPRMMSNVIDCAPEEVAIGLEVELAFGPAADGGEPLPYFRPPGGTADERGR
jgi:hypothetical protein